ncbi:MupA/Atu3671 family FMN-dependent luciferase-like monooxygenase [Streptomyces boncukensis]|uniref:LLM class flavin-dependent oxidoreductase n=1 Tax=Streptomyces boncukensis TaxID=2711219 RepID=A0A6G4X5N1_9ACTN|nr:LLM class flavin-dependent oxidoreductase [Streptomyces boncukensis]
MSRQPSFSLFFFSDDRSEHKRECYHLVLEAAKFADTHGFEAIWVPERHFSTFGAPYPNPSVLAAAIAGVTEHVRIRAGSVVVPLHHPVRIAEEWAMVDNLSHGRVGIAAASGWSSTDFALSDADYGRRREEMFERLETVGRLWRGEEAVLGTDGNGGPVARQSFPRPVQPELPRWIATVGTRATWIRAGELGHNVLTALVATTLDEVEGHIRAYREARARSGHAPEAGRVTLMIHTFLGQDLEEVRDTVRDPLIQYIGTHLDQSIRAAGSSGAGGQEGAQETRDDLARFAFERYFHNNGLFGTPETALATTGKLHSAGVDEIACLIDFGVDDDAVLAGLPYINTLRKTAEGVVR